MANQLERVMMCPICLETMSKPIVQCTLGHSMDGDCITANKIQQCPQCRSPLTKMRNYQLEQMIESLPQNLQVPCMFVDKGCKFLLTTLQKSNHEEECKFRKFVCEGRKFAKWKCEWYGYYDELEDHFKTVHGSNMEYKLDKDLNVNLTQNHRDVQIISFFNGAHYFWYKFMVDVVKEKVYWIFQFVGTKKQAENYHYEFEIRKGPIRKLKVTEVCDNDVAKAETLFDQEKCVALSFSTIKSYLNEHGKLSVKFRILASKKQSPASQ